MSSLIAFLGWKGESCHLCPTVVFRFWGNFEKWSKKVRFQNFKFPLKFKGLLIFKKFELLFHFYYLLKIHTTKCISKSYWKRSSWAVLDSIALEWCAWWRLRGRTRANFFLRLSDVHRQPQHPNLGEYLAALEAHWSARLHGQLLFLNHLKKIQILKNLHLQKNTFLIT